VLFGDPYETFVDIGCSYSEFFFEAFLRLQAMESMTVHRNVVLE